MLTSRMIAHQASENNQHNGCLHLSAAVADEPARRAASRQTCCKHASYLSQVASFNLPPPAFGASVSVTPVEFCRNLQHQKTKVPVLSCGATCVILRLTVSLEHRLVTDRQTDWVHTYLLRVWLAWSRLLCIRWRVLLAERSDGASPRCQGGSCHHRAHPPQQGSRRPCCYQGLTSSHSLSFHGYSS